jgi:hypothetical protein
LIPNSWANLSSAYLLCRTIYSVHKKTYEKKHRDMAYISKNHFLATWRMEATTKFIITANDVKHIGEKHIFISSPEHQNGERYLTNALLPLLGTLTGCSKYVCHLFVIKLLRVPLPFYNLACLQAIYMKHWTKEI